MNDIENGKGNQELDIIERIVKIFNMYLLLEDNSTKWRKKLWKNK